MSRRHRTNRTNRRSSLQCVFLADQHCVFEPLEIHGDVLLVCGDFLHRNLADNGRARRRALTSFRSWLRSEDFSCRLVVAGNHDFLDEQEVEYLEEGEFELHVLHGTEGRNIIRFGGLTFCGFPYTILAPDSRNRSSFVVTSEEEMERRFLELVPAGVDVLAMHTPVFGRLDLGGRLPGDQSDPSVPCDECGATHPRYSHWGSRSILNLLSTRRRYSSLKVVAFGHTHHSHEDAFDSDTIRQSRGILFVNCSQIPQTLKVSLRLRQASGRLLGCRLLSHENHQFLTVREDFYLHQVQFRQGHKHVRLRNVIEILKSESLTQFRAMGEERIRQLSQISGIGRERVKIFYHGTSVEKMMKLLQTRNRDFNMDFMKSPGNMLGDGAYLATDPVKSFEYCGRGSTGASRRVMAKVMTYLDPSSYSQAINTNSQSLEYVVRDDTHVAVCFVLEVESMTQGEFDVELERLNLTERYQRALARHQTLYNATVEQYQDNPRPLSRHTSIVLWGNPDLFGGRLGALTPEQRRRIFYK